MAHSHSDNGQERSFGKKERAEADMVVLTLKPSVREAWRVGELENLYKLETNLTFPVSFLTCLCVLAHVPERNI